MRRTVRVVLIGLVAAVSGRGEETCRTCHPDQFSTHSGSNHAAALQAIGRTGLPELLAGAPIRERSGIEFSYQRAAEGLQVTVEKNGRSVTASLSWAFGSGAQAITPVGIRNGNYFEHRVSYYTQARRPGRTLGHPGEPSRSLDSALGIQQDAGTIFRCFGCHATNVKPGPDLRDFQPGVQCARCHGTATAHVQTGGRMPTKTADLSAAKSVQVCAECHRAPDAGASSQPERDDPLSIRFQPVGLMASECFRKSNALTCVTCHDPHQNARRDAAFYTEKCIGCHSTASSTTNGCRRQAGENCLPCHMQKRSPADFLVFTDHRIRAYH